MALHRAFSKLACQLLKHGFVRVSFYALELSMAQWSSIDYDNVMKAIQNAKDSKKVSALLVNWIGTRLDLFKETQLAKLGSDMFDAGHIYTADKLFTYAASKGEQSEDILVRIAQARQLFAPTVAQIAAWEEVLKANPKNKTALKSIVRCYYNTGDFKTANDYFDKLSESHPESKIILSAQAMLATEAKEYEEANHIYLALTELHPEDISLKVAYVKSLLDTLEFEQASSYYEEHLVDKLRKDCALLEPLILFKMIELERAMITIRKLQTSYPNDKDIVDLKRLIFVRLYKLTNDRKYIEEVLRDFKHLKSKYPLHRRIDRHIINLHIYISETKTALDLIDGLNDEMKDFKLQEVQAWACYQQGDHDGSLAIWKDIVRDYAYPVARPPMVDRLKLTKQCNLDSHDNPIILFTVVKNEKWRLSWFLDYYRSLGVNYFIFIDNDSADGTLEYLHNQQNVMVYQTSQSYSSGYSGMLWINSLLDRHGANAWCIYADVDEALVYPGSETRSIRELVDYFDEQGYQAMYAFMMDMFSPGLKSVERGDNYDNFLEDYNLFLNTYERFNTQYCPYIYTTGGMRSKYEYGENQTKTPIIKGGVGIKFLMSSHVTTPAKVADVTGALLHYKMAGNFLETFRNDISNNTRIKECKARHYRYLKTHENVAKDLSKHQDDCVEYESTQQLLDLELIQTSKKF
ncbi:MAG: glycosyltransferase family 2 protein [Cyclobacteriaceae bacterium]